MRCRGVNKKLMFYIDGDLREDEAKDIGNHLEECPGCRRVYQDLQNSMRIIETEKKTEASPYLYTRIISRIEEYESTIIGDRKPLYIRLKPVYITIVIVIAVIAGMMVGNKVNIKNKSNEGGNQTNVYSINTTKDFYIYGEDEEYN